MSNTEALVGEFKEIVESKIARQVALYERMDRLENSHRFLVSERELFFASLPPEHSDRFSWIPQSSEHVWAIGPNRQIDTPDRYMGNMAIVAFDDKPTLSRGFSATVSGSQPGPFTIRQLSDSEVEQTLVWVKAPTQNTDVQNELSQLTQQERETIDPQIKTINDAFHAELLARRAQGTIN